MLRSSVFGYSHLLLGCAVPALLLAATPTRATAADVPPACTPTVARIVSIQGVVEMRRAGQRDWAAVTRLDTPMCQGDVVHAGPRSRVALVILPEKFVRLDQNSTVTISIDGDETVVEFFQDETTPKDACGAGYFITRFPRKFKVRTPFVNAAVEGTEFLVSMSCTATSVAVFEGKVSAETLLANAERFVLSSGETISAGPGEPPTIKVLIKPVDAVQWALYYPPLSAPGPGVGPDQQCDQPAPDERSRCLMVRAEQRLRVGRVDEAQTDIDASLKIVPDSSDANALLSVIDVAKNDRHRALVLAQHATQLDPVNPRAWISLSYAQQASFKLEDALASAERAAELEPRSSIALTRVAELMMSLGKIRSAQRAARAAVDANPNDSRAHTILGFAHLAEIDIKKAKADFEGAIALDSSDPLPRLGLGLAIIRGGNLTAGREQIEIAVALDPTDSLLRSYVGKAYYEENTKERDKLAAVQYGLAKQLDPKDPTPWFYDAILKQTQNKPVEALVNIQESIDRNDNRAVYRSRLLLDEDLAARSVNLARMYEDLDFKQAAVIQATESVSLDPDNFSAHEFLAGAYLLIPRYEIARESELLQAQLRQPLTSNPLVLPRPQDALGQSVPRVSVAPTIGLARPGFDLPPPLFDQNGAALYVDGLAGTHATYGDDLSVAVTEGKAAVYFAQSHFSSDEFRANRQISADSLGVLAQGQVTEQLGLQVEATTSTVSRGDIEFEFDPVFRNTVRLTQDTNTVRLGASLRLSPESQILLSGYQSNSNLDVFFPEFDFTAFFKTQASTTEAQYAYVIPDFSLVAGAGYLDGETRRTDVDFERDSRYKNAYIYTNLGGAQGRAQLSLGLSIDNLKQGLLQENEVCPKLGLVVRPLLGTTVRAAALKTVKRQLVANQTIEPTEVAGFNQFFDDLNGAVAWLYGIGVNQRVGGSTFFGIEGWHRDVKVPLFFSNAVESFTWRENSARAYFYRAISLSPQWASLALTIDYRYDEFSRPLENTGPDGVETLRTQALQLGLTGFVGSVWSGRITTTLFHQTGDLQVEPAADRFQLNESFWITNLMLSYRLAGRRGFLAIGVENLFNKTPAYQDIDPATPEFARGRLVYAKVILQF